MIQRLNAILIFLLITSTSTSQSFLNGDFETNTASVCEYNLTDPLYNAMMSNSVSFGVNPQLDVQTSGCFITPQSGNWCVGLTSTSTTTTDQDALSIELDGTLSAGQPYDLSFYTFGNNDFFPVSDTIRVGVSSSPSTFGTEIAAILPAENIWENHLISFIPSGAGILYLTLQMDVNTTASATWIQVDNFTIAEGCTPTVGTDTKIGCDTLTWIDGITYTSSNSSATHTLVNAAGCDSLVTLDLTMGYTNYTTDTISACDSLSWIDGTTYFSSTSTPVHVLTNSTGCDSIISLFLTLGNITAGIDTLMACDSLTWIDGVTYTVSNNSATHLLTNASGCDSIVTLNLMLGTSSVASIDALVTDTICNTDTPITLTAVPAGGAFSGVGMTGPVFDPFAASSGTHDILYTYIDSLGCVSTDTVSIFVMICLSIEEKNELQLTVYPNPTEGNINLSYTPDLTHVNVEVLDALGRVVSANPVMNGKSINIDLSDESAGMYFVSLSSDQGRSVSKVLLK